MNRSLLKRFFEGADNVYEGAAVNFSSEKIVIREIGDANKHAYTNKQINDLGLLTSITVGSGFGTTANSTNAGLAQSATSGSGSGARFTVVSNSGGNGITSVAVTTQGTGYKIGDTITIAGSGLTGGASPADDITLTVTSAGGILQVADGQFTITQTVAAASLGSLDILGLQTSAGANDLATTTDWVDEKAPALKVNYNENTQQLEFRVDRTVLGTGTESNFNSFSVFGATTAEASNNLGVPTQDDASTVLIRGGEVLRTDPFVADGEEIQLNDKRFGVSVNYNSDTSNFTFASGTTGELIAADGALGVATAQSASAISVGRYSLSTTDGSVIDSTDHFSGDNHLMSVGVSKSDAIQTAGRGLASTAAVSIGDAANEDLTSVFRMTNTNGENIFNVSVNGISGVIEIPTGFYVGSTLAEALESRINQIQDPVTGDTVGGVTVRYDSASNNFTFTTGTTGNTSTVKVKGAARFGLDDVPLGVGDIPQIYNLVQATNADGVALYVDATGNVVTQPPANLVEGYFPLYIDEGELTFDNGGRIISPKNLVHYERQEEGFSISLDIDFGQSTQFAQPFSVLNVEQDGFTSGRLDGLEIDASGTIRANYTNGQNNPLGKIVLANFNNQNGLKQIGNATYVETAVSGAAQVGEAGSEGYGNILSGSLERSNVDITEELVNLITAQRNFQASAKAIETTTTLTTTIINIR
jgi:flagellar hook protein FlgE